MSLKKITATLFLITEIVLASHAQTTPKINQSLVDSLNKWTEVDQIAAKNAKPAGAYSKLTQQQWNKFKDSVYSAHEKLLARIFDKYGFPGYNVAGEEGSHEFWLMVQHCDKDAAFQQKILTAMKAEVDRNNASGKDYGYLTDRVNLNTGKKQIYGTQVTYKIDICQAIPRPLADSATVDQRRKQIGMEPIEEYLNTMSQMHFQMNEEFYKSKGINQPKLIAVPGK